ncbi:MULTISPECIES: hypothetical protein [unclassified Methylobacterium]|uniref:hypothetical protein n=1 Tax=unclassified Methylobacterium TaxID=2615210 RepID=UPI00226AF713|nr:MULTISPECIES: hypothetical protein [unclassified Methylobacterium]
MKSPAKIVRDSLAVLVGAARQETSLDKLVSGLSEAHAQVEAATRDREAAEVAYRDGLLDASEAGLENLLREKGAATVRLDKAEALVAAFTNRIATVREAEARAARQAIHTDAVAKVEAIKARLPVEYRHHALAIRHLLRDLCEAEAAVARAATAAPDFPAIASPEAELRVLHGLPEEIVSSETVELWVVDGRTDPVPEQRQGDVRASAEHPGRGMLYLPGSAHHTAPTTGVPLTCTLRAFTHTRYREAVSPRDDGSLLRAVALPAFGLTDSAFVTASPYRDHNGALIELASDLPPPAPLGRPIREKLELLPAVPHAEAEVVQLRGAA